MSANRFLQNRTKSASILGKFKLATSNCVTYFCISFLLISLAKNCFANDSTAIVPSTVTATVCQDSYSTDVYGPWNAAFGNINNLVLGTSTFPNLCVGKTYYVSIFIWFSGANQSWADFPFYNFCGNSNCGGDDCGGTLTMGVTNSDVTSVSPYTGNIGTWASYKNTSSGLNAKFRPTTVNEGFPPPIYRNGETNDCVTIAFYRITFSISPP